MPVKGSGWQETIRPGKVVCRNCRQSVNAYNITPCSLPAHQQHIIHAKQASDRWTERTRTDVLIHYGGKCACCGYANIETKRQGQSFLQIDHINGGGNQHYRSLGHGGGARFYRWLQKQNYPRGYRVLCAGCNNSMQTGADKCILHADTDRTG